MNARLVGVATLVGLSLSAAAGALVVPPGGVVVPQGTHFPEAHWLGPVRLGVHPVYYRSAPVLNQAGQEVSRVELIVQRYTAGAFSERVYDMITIGSVPTQSHRPLTFTIDGYSGLAVNTNWRNDIFAGGAPVTKITRSDDGDRLTFDLGAAQTSHFVAMPVFVYTDSSVFRNTGTLRVQLSDGRELVFTDVPVPIPPCAEDTNADGVINFADLNRVLTNFGEACP